MEKKEFCGEYLAPRVKFILMQPRRAVLTGSPVTVSNPFGGEEDEW